MAVTHADLAPTRKNTSDVGSKTGAFVTVLSITLGLFCFILCVIAETSRSEVKWNGHETSCAYNSDGKTPFLSSTIAFFVLAMAMALQHTYLLVAVSKSDTLVEITWDSDSPIAKSFTMMAGFFFVTTWMSFTVGEILLLIGLSVESGHLKSWETWRPSCLIIQKGLFISAGIFGLLTVFLASGLYMTILVAQRRYQQQETSYQTRPTTVARIIEPTSSVLNHEDRPMPIRHDDRIGHTLYHHHLTSFEKQSSSI